MLIVMGPRVVRRPCGYVAVYCPFCAEARASLLTDVREMSALLGVPVGQGKSTSNELRCRSCRETQVCKPGRYPLVSSDRDATIEELVDQTNRALPEEIAERLDLREAAARGEVSQEERLEVMREPLAHVAQALKRRAREQGHYAGPVSGLLLLSLACVPLFLLDVGGVSRAGLGVAAAVVVVVAVLLALTPRWLAGRAVRAHYRSYLVRELMTMRPALEELQEALRDVRREGLRIARRVDARWLHAEIEKELQPPGATAVLGHAISPA